MVTKGDPCNLCGQRKKTLMFSTNYGQIFSCKHCGLVFLISKKSEGEIRQIYENEDYFCQKTNSGLSYFSYEAERPVYLNYFRRKMAQIALIQPWGKILDVGCGLGFFLEAATREGWETKGVEVSRYAADYVSQTLGLKVFRGTLEALKLPSDSFDVVTLFQLVEHLPNPLRTLLEVKRLLKPGGLVVLTTPNQGGILARILGRRWFQYKYQGHLYFFNPGTLKLLLNKAGFQEVKIGGDGWQFLPARFILSRLVYLYSLPLLEKLLKIKTFGNLPIPFSFGYLMATASKL